MKSKSALVYFVLIFSFSVCSCSDNTFVSGNDGHVMSTKADYATDSPYEFPIRIGQPAWKNFKSGQEMLLGCQMPSDLVHKMTTKALCETCLEYPLAFDYIYANDEKTAVPFFIENFNGLNELSKREDFFNYLLESYTDAAYDPDYSILSLSNKGSIFYIGYIELIFTTEEFFKHIDKEGLAKLLKVSMDKYTYEVENNEAFGTIAIRRTMMLAGKCILTSNENLTSKDRTFLKEYVDNYSTFDIERLGEVSLILIANMSI